MSPKNKGKFGKGKPAVEMEDEFISTMGRLSAKLQPHVKQITAGVAVVLALLFVFFGYRSWSERKEAHATALYMEAVMLTGVPIVAETAPPAAEGTEQEGDKALPTIKDENRDGIPDSFPSEVERARAALVPLAKLRSDYGSTAPAAEATLLYASLLYDAGQYAEARDMYQVYLQSGATDVLKVLAREGLGHAQEALAMSVEGEQRMAALQAVYDTFGTIQTSDEGPERDRALYHQARILAEMGKRDEAISALKKALEIAPEGSLSYDINERLAQLQSAK